MGIDARDRLHIEPFTRLSRDLKNFRNAVRKPMTGNGHRDEYPNPGSLTCFLVV